MQGGDVLGFQETFKALSDATRREILTALKGGRLSAGEIGAQFPTSGATISHHLAILKNANLITDQREGKFIFYELNLSVFEEAMIWIKNLLRENSDEK